jgi:hypothetical protein
MQYRKGEYIYAEYFHKGVWKVSASVKNEDVDKMNNKKAS